MSTDLGEPFPLDYRGRPRQMSTIDATIWDRYQPTIDRRAHALYFDVHLGEGAAAEGVNDPNILRQWKEATQKRADVVIEFPDHWLLIELRDNAMASALGRLGLYATLWRRDPPDTRPLFLALVTNRTDPDVESIAAEHGIAYTVI